MSPRGSLLSYERIMAWGCMHAPFTDQQVISNLCAKIEEFKPTMLVNLGDTFEGGAASVHANEYDHDLLDEYASAAESLQTIRRVAGDDTKLVWLLGNHDDNIQTRDPRRIPKPLRACLHWSRSEYSTEFARWRTIQYNHNATGCFQVGQLIFLHGFAAGVNSDCDEALLFSNLTGCHAHRLVVRAHTHRPVRVTQCNKGKIKLPTYYANVGTCGPLKPDYTKRLDTSQWGAACLQAVVKKGRACMPGREWEAEVVPLDDRRVLV